MVCLKIKPEVETEDQVVNICTMVKVWFDVVPKLDENVILTPSVVELQKYWVLAANCQLLQK